MLPLKFFDTISYGDIMSRLTNDVDTIGRTLENTLSTIVTSLTTLIAIPIILFSMSWQLTLIALCEIPLSLLVVFVIVKNNQKYYVRQQKYLGEINGHILHTMLSKRSMLKKRFIKSFLQLIMHCVRQDTKHNFSLRFCTLS